VRCEVGEETDVIGTGNRTVVAVGDPGIESRFGQSTAQVTGSGAELVIRD
jgi:hypothetical protein